MKIMILAAIAAIGLGAANAQSLSHAVPHQQQTGNNYNFLAGGGG